MDVVVVDDSEDVRAVVGRSLDLDGRFRVVGQGATGRDAVELAATHRPSIMILDASMPELDGLGALTVIRERSPRTKIVLFSGFGGAAFTSSARALGAADVIDKALPLRSLAARLLQLVGWTTPQEDRAPDAPSQIAPDADTEAVLGRQLERFKTVFDQGTIGMATMTLAGTIVRANEGLCAMLGVSEPQLVSSDFACIADDDAQQALRDAIADVAAGRRDATAIEHPVGSPAARWLRTTVAAVRGTGTRPVYLFAQAEDVTGRRQAVQDLRRSEERFRLLVEGVRDYAIFMLDPNGHITTWNLGAERMKGYRAEEIVGQHFRVFYDAGAQARRHPEHELELAVEHGRYEEEGWRIRKDGTRFWANVVITALFDHGGVLAGFAKVTRDITERRVASQAQERFTSDLQHANRLLQLAAQQTAEFVAMAVHELNSPIAAVTGAAQILRDHWQVLDEDDRTQTLQSILRGGERLRRLMDDLLVVSRLEAGSFDFDLDVVPLGKVIRDVVQDHAELLGPVEVSCPADLSVRADALRCMQILTNLVINAGTHGSPPVRIEATRCGRLAEVRVYDGGGGPPEAAAERLFDKFVQGVRRTERGTGLGLYIVRELARGQGGDAWHEGTGDGESCFAFSLPAA